MLPRQWSGTNNNAVADLSRSGQTELLKDIITCADCTVQSDTRLTKTELI